jgi:hypothetical protein
MDSAIVLAQPCKNTAQAAHRACHYEAQDNLWTARGNCENQPTKKGKQACKNEASDSQREARDECNEQFEARKEVCDLVGQDAYHPDFNPANFVDPPQIGNTVPPNPYFPLVPGNRWVYEGGGETDTVVVTDKTKLIEGVTCVVVNDLVEEDGKKKEDTDDWYAQALNGDVWYCGEAAKDFETFAGDNPEEPELVSTDGSFKAGRDGAKPGIIMFANPQVGKVYRQEFALGEAEDLAEIISLTGNEQIAADIPAAKCNNDCLVTRDFTPLEPGVNGTNTINPASGLSLKWTWQAIVLNLSSLLLGRDCMAMNTRLASCCGPSDLAKKQGGACVAECYDFSPIVPKLPAKESPVSWIFCRFRRIELAWNLLSSRDKRRDVNENFVSHCRADFCSRIGIANRRRNEHGRHDAFGRNFSSSYR